MRIAFWLTAWVALIPAGAWGSVVAYSTTNLFSNTFRVSYSISGVSSQASGLIQPLYQQVDIRFDPALVTHLSNPQVPAGFSSQLLQPDNPPGVFGDFIVMVVSGGLSQLGPFSLDVVMTPPGPLGAQPFFLNQFDAAGNFLFTLEAGFTSSNTVPEPVVSVLVGIGLLAGGALWRVRGRSRGGPDVR